MPAASLPPVIPSLDLLFEPDGLRAFDLPPAIASAYPGTLGFDEPRVFANFVASVDGVVAIPSVPGSNKLIAAASDSDRFVMGLLRASADALVIGAGTLAASPRSVWSAAQAFPAAADAFTALRAANGREDGPEVVVLSARGSVDPAHPCLVSGAVVLTTDEARSALARVLPAASVAIAVGSGGRLDPRRALAALHDRGHRLILSEGGSHSLGPWLEAGIVDELFLTISPLLIGRTGHDPRLGLVEGADLLPGGPLTGRLLGVRRDGGHLFLRYDLTADE